MVVVRPTVYPDAIALVRQYPREATPAAITAWRELAAEISADYDDPIDLAESLTILTRTLVRIVGELQGASFDATLDELYALLVSAEVELDRRERDEEA